jgi:hypothetical protein
MTIPVHILNAAKGLPKIVTWWQQSGGVGGRCDRQLRF